VLEARQGIWWYHQFWNIRRNQCENEKYSCGFCRNNGACRQKKETRQPQVQMYMCS